MKRMEEEKIYHSLSELQRRRRHLRNEIATSEKMLAHHWRTLLRKDKHRHANTPTERLTRLVSTGAGIVDAALLAWKLYRKFRR